MSGLTVLIDDVRRFRDGRPGHIARSSADGLALLAGLFAEGERIEQLWLDHDLGGADTIWPVIRFLEEAAAHTGLSLVHQVFVHAAGSGNAHRMLISLRRAGYLGQRVSDPRLFTWSAIPTKGTPSWT
jgi:hypothetical protein